MGGGRVAGCILDYSKLKVRNSGKNFIFRRGGRILDYSKLKVPSSGQIFMGGGGKFLTTQNSECQVLAKFSFFGRKGYS